MPPGARKRRAARRKQQQQQQHDQQQQQSEDSQPNSPHPQGNGNDLSSDQSEEDRMESNGHGVEKTSSSEVFVDAVDSPVVSPPPPGVVSPAEDSPPKEENLPTEEFPPKEELSPGGDSPPKEDSSPEDSPKVYPVEPAAAEMAAIPVTYVDTVNEEVVQAMEDKAVVSETVADAIVVSVVEGDGPETAVPVTDENVGEEERKVPEKGVGGEGIVEEGRDVGDEVNPVPLVRHRATIWNCCGLFGVDG